MRERIFRATLLGKCVLASLFRKRVSVSEAPKTVIVVVSGKLGDIVCGTPVLRALRKHLPQTRIIVAGGNALRAVLKDSGLVDEFLDLDSRGALSRAKACHADAAVITGPSFVPAALLYRARVPLVVIPRVVGGYSPGAETIPYRILQQLVITFPYAMGAYAPRERLRALEPLGIVTDDTKKQLGYSKGAAEKAAHLLVEKGIDLEKDFVVGVSVTAGNKIKEWPVERFAEVVSHLIEGGRNKVVFFGGPEDRRRVEDVIEKLKKPNEVVNTQGKLTIDELKALISRLNLFIAVDTGPIYIAEAFGVPTVDIVGPMNEKEQPPRGFIHRNVVPPERQRAELSILNARSYNQEEAMRQTLSITVSAVLAETERLIHDLQEKGEVRYTEPS